MKLLDQSKLCQGNAEPKFIDLLHRHQDVLKQLLVTSNITFPILGDAIAFVSAFYVFFWFL